MPSALPVLAVFDDDGAEVQLDADEATTLLALTDGLDEATVSACPTCRSRIVAAVALADLLGDAPPFSRGNALIELADDAPTLHLYVRDLDAACRHPRWRDPGFEEWSDAIAEFVNRELPRY
ncbi:MAG: hypothetical protein WEB19_01950 [Acidimicrobiia bacterium]